MGPRFAWQVCCRKLGLGGWKMLKFGCKDLQRFLRVVLNALEGSKQAMDGHGKRAHDMVA